MPKWRYPLKQLKWKFFCYIFQIVSEKSLKYISTCWDLNSGPLHSQVKNYDHLATSKLIAVTLNQVIQSRSFDTSHSNERVSSYIFQILSEKSWKYISTCWDLNSGPLHTQVENYDHLATSKLIIPTLDHVIQSRIFNTSSRKWSKNGKNTPRAVKNQAIFSKRCEKIVFQ